MSLRILSSIKKAVPRFLKLARMVSRKISYSLICIYVARHILASRQPYLEIRILLGENFRLGGKIPHRVTAAAVRARVGHGPVNDPGVMQGALARLQLEVNGFGLVHILDLLAKGVDLPVHRLVIREPVVVRTRD